MLKILVVDDFSADRENISHIIRSFKDIKGEVIGECENGIEACKVMDRIKPDIVISDIEMPLMDGFELARAIKRDFQDVRIIFCSLYNEAAYIKKALYFDNYGYILKPVNPDELKECIVKAEQYIDSRARIEKENEDLRKILQLNRPILIENFIKELIHGINTNEKDIWDKVRYYNLNLKEGGYILVLLEINDFERITENLTVEQKHILSLKVFGGIKAALAGFENVVPVRMDESHFINIYNIENHLLAEECYNKITEDCESVLTEFRKSDISISISVSDFCTNIKEIGSLFEQCNYLIRHKYILGKGITIYSNDVPSSIFNKETDYKTIQKEIRFLLNSGSIGEIKAYMSRLFGADPAELNEQYIKNVGSCLIMCMLNVLYENNESFKTVFKDERVVWEKFMEFETFHDMQNWLLDSLIRIREYLSSQTTSRNKKITEEVKQYVARNFERDLSVEKISSELYYSYNYLNSIFKQETGETIFYYISMYKIEKAKEMLLNSKMKLYEITEALGYSHTAYFSNLFKKHTGLTLKEYRERNGL